MNRQILNTSSRCMSLSPSGLWPPFRCKCCHSDQPAPFLAGRVSCHQTHLQTLGGPAGNTPNCVVSPPKTTTLLQDATAPHRQPQSPSSGTVRIILNAHAPQSPRGRAPQVSLPGCHGRARARLSARRGPTTAPPLSRTTKSRAATTYASHACLVCLMPLRLRPRPWSLRPRLGQLISRPGPSRP